ncbi:MAG: hypothetical protein Q8Q26_13170 [Pseudorhodobacter sp.]|nr:hypothetical protein [Pseudorhodobacter sp.]
MSAKSTFELPPGVAKRRETLLVIDAPEATAMIAELDPQPAVVLVRYALLDAALLARVKPDCIVLPLLRAGFDVAQALQRLVALGYRGKVCALAKALPDRAMVEVELRAFALGLTVHLIEIPALGQPALPPPPRR